MQKKKKSRFLANLPFYLMGLPGMIYLFINNYLPLFGLQIAFKDFKYSEGVWGSKWNGLANFEFLFKSNVAERIIRNTLGYSITFLLLGMVLNVFVAIMLNEILSSRTKKIWQTLILLPHLISMVIVAYLVYACGDTDMRHTYTSEQANSLAEKGYHVLYKEYPGGHEWNVWRPAARDFVKMLFEK